MANQGDVLLDPLHVPMYFYFLYITPPYSLKHIHLDLGGGNSKVATMNTYLFFSTETLFLVWLCVPAADILLWHYR